MRTAVLAFALSSAVLSSPAGAQSESSAPPPQPAPPSSAAYVQPPPAPAPYALPPPPQPPPAAPVRGFHEHDGFYFGVGLGVSYVTDSIGSNLFREASLSGVGLADKMAIGGTIARGLVLGGAIEDSTTFSPALRVNGKRESSGPTTFGLSLIGPFLDYYFDPSSGLHAQALLGLSVLTADGDKNLPVGFGGSLSIGQEWWIGAQGSLGFLARIAYGRLWYRGTNVDERHSVFAPAILVQYTYH